VNILYRIEQYTEKYKYKLIEFITEILVEELGFEMFREPLKDSSFCDNENKMTWIALNEDDDIIGTITLEEKENLDVFLKKFYVKKECRGKGISKELFNTFLNFANFKKYEKVFLGTYESLNRAISFYTKNGFEEYNKDTINNNERHFCLKLVN